MPSERIKDALAPLLAERDQALAELAEIDAQRAAKKEEIAELEGVLRKGGLIESPQAKKQPKMKKSERGYISEEMLDLTRDNLPDGPFCISDLADLMEVSQASAKNGIDALVDTGELRFLGKRPKPGQVGGVRAKHWESIESVPSSRRARN